MAGMRKPSQAELRKDVLRHIMQQASYEEVSFCWERDEPVNPQPLGEWRWVASIPQAKIDVYVAFDSSAMLFEMPDWTRVVPHDANGLTQDRARQVLWISHETGESFWGNGDDEPPHRED